MRRAVLLWLVCLCTIAGLATAASDRLTFANAGFSIAPLEGAESVIMTVPAAGGFSPNVNVQAQRYPGSLDDYISLSKGQFRQMSLTVVSERKAGNTGWVVEYTGEMSGRPLHWYSRAVWKRGTVYLATGTASKELWPSYSTRLKACVDSVSLTR
jgi:hypothetical protein